MKNSKRVSHILKFILVWLVVPTIKAFKRLKKFVMRKDFFWLMARVVILGVFAFGLFAVYTFYTMPDPRNIANREVPESTKIFARDGSILYEIHGEYKRTVVTYDQISENVKKATVAIEDKNFYEHHGVDWRGIMRSVLRNTLSFNLRGEGGSTITQQFVKNAFLTREKSVIRKLKEIIYSLALETRYSKEEILSFYLNEIPYGRNAYGIESASLTYFGKHASELSISESAYLASIPQRPTYFNPLGPNRDKLDARKNTVLKNMFDQKLIDQTSYDTAKNEVPIFTKKYTTIQAPHFVFYIQDYLASKYGETSLEEGGLKVYTTLDPKLQKIAEDAIAEQVPKNEKKGAYNASLVSIDPKTGQVLAMVGSKDFFGEKFPKDCISGTNCKFDGQVNISTTPQQPGSSFKPFVYLTAFTKKFSYAPSSLLMDVVTNFGSNGQGGSYIPKNYNFNEYGPVSMRKALAGSLNVPAVKTLALVGVENATNTAKNLGITSELKNCGLSLVLGGCGVKLLDHTSAFATLANGGEKHQTTAILEVKNKKGETLEEYEDKSEQIIDPQAVYQLTSILSDNTARSYIFTEKNYLTLGDRPVAAKTGTTNEFRDAWTVGYTPQLTTGVWVGNNDNSKMSNGSDGSVVAAPIWNKFMSRALDGQPKLSFEKPDGISFATVDKVSGKLPTKYTAETKTEVFGDYNLPKTYDDVHVGVTNPTTNQPMVYEIFKAERPEWQPAVDRWCQQHNCFYPGLNATPGDPINEPTPSTDPTTNPGNTSIDPNTLGEKPEVSIDNPISDSIIYADSVELKFTPFFTTQVLKIEILLDGELITTIKEQSIHSNTQLTEVLKNNLTPGRHVISVRATNTNNQTGSSSTVIFYKTGDPIDTSE